MEISDIRVRLIQESKERLRAVCSVTFDDAFVVRDVKIVDGTNGTFVAMPSRKLSIHCPKCRHKNQIRARYCNECGGKLPPARPPEDSNGRSRFHRDIAHPINTEFRELFQAKVLEAFEQELAENGNTHDSDSDHERSGGDGRSDERADGRSDDRAPVETVETRPAADEEVEAVEEKSEYDSLIAGLKPGGGRSRDSGRGERPRSDGDRDRGRARSGRGPSEPSRGGESRGQRQAESQKREEKTAPPPARPVERVIETSAVDATNDNEDTQFGAEILIETQTPKKAIPATKPEPVQEVVEAVDDDDGGFGAGLL